MILDRIIIENFGAYAEKQEALLTPESRKPVILFGGMNGGGKTTLLDSIQLVLYGPKARLSNRGRMGYRSYLAESIHRGSDPIEGASITLQFHRIVEGITRHFEIQRSWRETDKGISESVQVSQDGEPHESLTKNWDETIDSWLPAGISHLFFFDGEQIKDLADGNHAAEIIGTALYSLLGLDLVDRLETDLKVFEGRKRKESTDSEGRSRLQHAEEERDRLFEEEKALSESIAHFNSHDFRDSEKKLKAAETRFKKEGGDLYTQRKQLVESRGDKQRDKAEIEDRLRKLASGPMPLMLVAKELKEAETQARREVAIHHARILTTELTSRDETVIDLLKEAKVNKKTLDQVSRSLEAKRDETQQKASEPLVFDSDEHLAAELSHLQATVLPRVQEEATGLLSVLESIEEDLAKIESEIERIPDEDRIANAIKSLELARKTHEGNQSKQTEMSVQLKTVSSQLAASKERLSKLELEQTDSLQQEDEQKRMLTHSAKVRDTLSRFRVRIIKKHAQKIESLMLEAFQTLLRKSHLVSNLTIDPETFLVTLYDRQGDPLPFDRLSAGERQLLATSLLWGLARASGRPVPTIIDTPLGRLDSSHRKHLIERYFPDASHQVILLSTDEEIVGDYLKSLKPFVSRSYLLANDEALGRTQIEPGYFAAYEFAN